jgi:RNA polymerase sigma-B factor
VPTWEARLADARRNGDPAARAVLIEECVPLARSLSRRFRRSNDTPDDLVQVACLGLVKAVDRFDPERGTHFPSYAVPSILGELRRHLRDKTWRVRMPRKLQNLVLALGPVTEALSAELQRAPTVAELANCMLVSPEEILDAREASDSQWQHSLDEPAHRNGSVSLGDTLDGQDHELDRSEDIAELKRWTAMLPARQREILRLRFEEDLTQREISDRMGISQMHVSRLLRRSLDTLGVLAGVG